jgi:glycosyltransferase involved in cell wall biosynthesis
MSPRIALIAAMSGTGEIGGAERLFVGLRDALNDAGLTTELLPVYSNEADFQQIEETYLRFYDLDVGGFDGVISAKAPAYVVRHPNHVCYLMHTMRVFYDMFEFSFPVPTAELLKQRRLVHALDTAALQYPRTRRILTIGEEVAARLRAFNGLEAARIVRHPTTLQGLRSGAFKYLFMPGRLHKWKRIDLAIEIMRHVKTPIELLISGSGEDAARVHALAQDVPQVRFLGRVSDEQLIALYADALAVLFLPIREDLGLITLEAFGSGKPVITCGDSGEPARLVRDQWSGFVCDPDPLRIAERIDRLAGQPDLAAKMGERGKQSIASITWGGVAAALAGALGFDAQTQRGTGT